MKEVDGGRVLLTGSTGYVGGRLLNRLLKRGIRTRCLVRRRSDFLSSQDNKLEYIVGDVLDESSLRQALCGVHTAYYLIHTMGAKGDFESKDRLAAENFAKACSSVGVKKIVYLGGLGDPDHDLSRHLQSRQEVGDILRTSNAKVIEFRASIIIGSGSLSFEMVRTLVERLPLMVCPKWVQVRAQPIAIEDVLEYLIGALELDINEDLILEIGGPDQLSYGEIMRCYAKQRGLKRLMIPVPLLTPYLSSLWLGLVTPLYARVGRKLVDSMRNPTLVSNNLADDYFSIKPRSTTKAIQRALENEDEEFAETRWSDALSAAGRRKPLSGVRFGSRLVDSRTVEVKTDCKSAFDPIRRIGGNRGWYFGDFLWKIRGFLDLLVGGVGTRRGRRHPSQLKVGDAVDFWRVEAFEEDRFLKLAAEMKVPGRAWLEFEVTESKTGSTIRQTATFDPLGLSGLLYWYSLYPAHQFVFRGMLNGIARRALQESETS